VLGMQLPSASGMRFRTGFDACIGETPLILLSSLSHATSCLILGKAEFMNPGGSVKDRAALYMINAAEREGAIKKGGWLVEATAGNTGIGLVHIANQRGYKCLFTCSASTSEEKIRLLQTLGAEIVRCPAVPPSHPDHFQNQAKRLAQERGGFFVNQFYNLSNMEAHYNTTGPEIWRDTAGQVGGIALAAGTGGTIAGTSRYIKEKNNAVCVALMDIPGSGIVAERKPGEPFLVLREKTSEEKAKSGSSVMEGIGSSLLYANLAQAQLDEVLYADEDATAIEMAHFLLKKEGIFVGSSSALNCVAAYLLAKKMGPGHCIVTCLCDGGERYSSKIYNPKWLEEKSITISSAEDLSFLGHIEGLNNSSTRG